MRHLWRPRFNPSGSFRVFVNPIPIGIMRSRKRVSQLHGAPMLPEEIQIAACIDVVLHRHYKKRIGIGSGIKIGSRFPVDKIRSLREFVHHLAIGALSADQKLERGTAQREVPVTVDSVERPERIASEEPAKTGAS